VRAKIALFCNVSEEAVITARDVPTVYEVPLSFRDQNLDELLVRRLKLPARQHDLKPWRRMVARIKHPVHQVDLAVVGKYVELKDAYKSIAEALTHAGIANNARVNVKWIDSERIEKEGVGLLAGMHGVLIPGGFGDRGIEGKIAAVRCAREKKIPFFGICLGMQLATVEFARNVLSMRRANSTEFDPQTPHPVIDLMREQKTVKEMGGTMRLGSYPCRLLRHSQAFRAYGKEVIFERHRHRYEFNNAYRERFMQAGLTFCGLSPDGRLVEMIELRKHPWFVAGQFHPEFQSRPNAPHPLFREFVRAALEHSRRRNGGQNGTEMV
jgi:CTP synthase